MFVVIVGVFEMIEYLFQYVYVFVEVWLYEFVVCIFVELVYVIDFWQFCVGGFELFVEFELVCEIIVDVVVVEWQYCEWIVVYDVLLVDGCCGCFGIYCCGYVYVFDLVVCFGDEWYCC